MPLLTSASLNEISPFYEPGAPPPTLPILIAQTEVGHVDPPAKLLATEEIGSGSTVSRFAHSKPRYNPYTKPSQSLKPSKRRPATPAPREDSPLDDDASQQSTDTDSDTDSTASGLIPPPGGEVTRKGRGGYNLETKLGWDHKEYLKVKKYIKKLVRDHLDITQSITRQKKLLVRKVEAMAADKFTSFHRYEKLWPVTDFIRLELKYTASRSKLKK